MVALVLVLSVLCDGFFAPAGKRLTLAAYEVALPELVAKFKLTALP